MNKYICVHGHFYQPPRENPWLEEIEIQDSAFPYNDWNERITAECYYPNSASRVLDDQGRIRAIMNNYGRMSFNFGPTLLSWLKRKSPEVYQAVLDADGESQARFSGHGAAIAQVYNHIIMPLANDRDKRTQVIWGIKDFEHRFHRFPEGMWLAETAVDTATLEILAEYGIRFTILSPYQARRVKFSSASDWQDVSGGRVDPKKPYWISLPSGRKIAVFFYDGGLAMETAFGDLLKDGNRFTHKILSAFSPEHSPQLVHIATDGETYGHHHKFGNMALSFLLQNHQIKPTVYAELLERFPPQAQVEIHENSSWSCGHGIERWRSDCGCRIGGPTKVNQQWRAHLRQAMDGLRDQLSGIYEKEMTGLLPDPWKFRDDYIALILNREERYAQEFLQTAAGRRISPEEKVKILRLAEMQRHALLMYTSCGWFFDDISGIEPAQIMQYAGRAIQIAREISGQDLEEPYLTILSRAKSNNLQMEDGRKIYEAYVKPAMIDLVNVGVHYAISSLFQKYPRVAKIYAYTVKNEIYHKVEFGRQCLLIGKARVKSEITHHELAVDFAVLHFGDYNLSAGGRLHGPDTAFEDMRRKLELLFRKNNIPGLVHAINQSFGEKSYSLWDLFKNEQGKAVEHIFEYTLKDIESKFREIYNQYYPLMQVQRNIRMSLPKALAVTVEFVLVRDLCDLLEKETENVERLTVLVAEMNRWGFTRDKDRISLIATRRLDAMMRRLFDSFGDVVLLETITAYMRILSGLKLDWDLWRPQETYFKIGKKLYHIMKEKEKYQDETVIRWLKAFDQLGGLLHVRICP
ncbi:MAG: DUF3536 domain-containing protein [Candidatus Omnitrophica bacterium]|nr:DUF3536 domain-containing protein [Candidatus Omnitrophota bacterium]